MFEQLKKRWEVNGFDLVLIISTFAVGGSLCGFLGRQLLLITGLEKGIWWIVVYIIVMTLIWPLCVLLVSIPLGQFHFFRKYLLKIATRMHLTQAKNTHVAIFASGAGSNAEKIIQHLHASEKKGIIVRLILCNKEGAGVLDIAKRYGIETVLIERERFFHGDHYLPVLRQYEIDFLVLAGFLWKVPAPLVAAFPEKMVNIHPALLPKFGGKGMYGDKVHEAVIAAGEKESGITIHFVDELYDHGKIVKQARCSVDAGETPESLAKKIHTLEHQYFPQAISELLNAK
jgi:formyltetrahydrofolate-dependent phosphoribosylglycinamide formyltransferase